MAIEANTWKLNLFGLGVLGKTRRQKEEGSKFCQFAARVCGLGNEELQVYSTFRMH